MTKNTGSKTGFILNLIAGIITSLYTLLMFFGALILSFASSASKDEYIEGFKDGAGMENGDISWLFDFLSVFLWIAFAIFLFYSVSAIFLAIKYKSGDYTKGLAVFGIIIGSIYAIFSLFGGGVVGIGIGALIIIGSSIAISDLDKQSELEETEEEVVEVKPKTKKTTKKSSSKVIKK